jgi:hypothetical protein
MGRRISLLFFVTVFLLYLAFSPAVFWSMGYMYEEIVATKAILQGTGLVSFPGLPETIQWPRNGLAALLVHVPFVLLARMLFPSSPLLEDAVYAIEPVALMAGTATVLFMWLRRRGLGVPHAAVFAAGFGFCTMAWPYAYIGLETTQAFFLLLAAYLAFEHTGTPRWPEVIALGLAAAMAVSAKSTGAILLPAAAFLVWRRFREENQLRIPTERLPRAISVVAIIVVVFAPNFLSRIYLSKVWGGEREFLSYWVVKDPFYYAMNVVAFIGSPNKGLIVFAPLAVLGLLALPLCWRRDRELAVFVILLTGTFLATFSAIILWTDETWGPRYLTTLVAPLTLVAALRYQASGRPLRRQFPLLVALVFGFLISLLGAIYSYGALHKAATDTGQSTIQNLQSNIVWNHPRFNARLFRTWLMGDPAVPALWTPYQIWYFAPPPDAQPFKAFDLREVMVPHSVLMRHWGTLEVPQRGLWLCALAALIAGVISASLFIARAGPGDLSVGRRV